MNLSQEKIKELNDLYDLLRRHQKSFGSSNPVDFPKVDKETWSLMHRYKREEMLKKIHEEDHAS